MSDAINNNQGYFNKHESTIFVCELFDKLGTVRSIADRQAILNEYINIDHNHSHAIRCIVECVFHPAIEFGLPSGEPPFTRMDAPDPTFAPTDLIRVVKKFPRFIKESPQFIDNSMKRENIFIQTLEALHPDEADILVAVKDKKLPTNKYRGVTNNLFLKTFSDWLPDNHLGKQ